MTFQVTLSCKILSKSDPVPIPERDLTKVTLLAADHTETITISVWNDQIKIVDVGKCYIFKNVTVRIFNEEFSLTTNINSEISEIEDIINAIDPPQEEAIQDIDAVEVTSSNKCPICFNSVDCDMTEATVKCSICNKKTLTRNLKSVLTLKVTMDKKKHVVPVTMLATILPDYSDKTVDEIEDFLLLHSSVKSCNNSIVSLIKNRTQNYHVYENIIGNGVFTFCSQLL